MKNARNSRVLRVVAIAALAAGLTASVAFAQDENDDEDQADADVRFRRESNLSGAEQMARGRQYIAVMKNIRIAVQTMLAAARRERDIIKVTCLNDKLTQIDVNSRNAAVRLEELVRAVRINDDGAADHEFRIMTTYKQKVDTLKLEADQCAGIEGDVFTRPQLDVEIDPNITEGDPTQFADPTTVVERPPSASGYF